MTSATPERPVLATYRLQVRNGTTLDEVRDEWLGPLADLGITHLYLSPVFRATEGSTHGYDIVDPNRVDEAIGGEQAFVDLCEAAHERGIGVVVDIVPNHLATDHDRNEQWWDLLRNGPTSATATMFDLDWDAPEQRPEGRLLLPVLGDHYGRELERGEFHLELGEHDVVLVHPAVTAPLDIGSLSPFLRALAVIDERHHDVFDHLARAAAELPTWNHNDAGFDAARRRATEPGLRTMVMAALHDPAFAPDVATQLATTNADIEALDDLIGRQPYRLARWQTSLDDLAYRRFFDINTLIGVRVDRPDVFEQTHRAVRRWVDHGLVDGLRVDHVDGLRDPAGYLERLRAAAPDAWIVVEKILVGPERLPPWAIDGTTGYEAGELISRLDLDDEGRSVLERTATDLTGADTDVEDIVRNTKAQVLDELLAADLNRLTESLLAVCKQRRRFRDVTRRELRTCLQAVLVRFGVYRTYVRPGETTGDADRAVIDAVLAGAADDLPELDAEIVEILGLLLPGTGLDPDDDAAWDFVLRLQQLSGPTMAKGAEDTAWFRIPTLASRCEVGAEPGSWGVSLDEFHEEMEERQRTWPLAMTATSTHDSKRSEDVRARLGLLSQDSHAWADTARSWMELTAGSSPDPAVAYQILQALVGAWPIDDARLGEYALKAVREAKQHTSWLRPNGEFEEAVTAFVADVLADDAAMDVVRRWTDRHDRPWRAAVLAQKLLALTVPGVPDLYQGSERAFLRLTDPDNRHRADPNRLRGDLDAVGRSDRIDPWGDLAKPALVQAALRCRRDHPDAFGAAGSYEPLWAAGPRTDHAVAFTRGTVEGPDVVVIVPRRVMGVAEGWKGTVVQLPDGEWASGLPASIGDTTLDAGTAVKGMCDLDDLLSGWPVALLRRR